MAVSVEKEASRKICSIALCAVMQYRKVTKAELAKGTNLSYKTICKYCYGENDIAGGKAYNIIEIEHYLDVDGRVLTGSLPIEYFFEMEREKLKEADKERKRKAGNKAGIRNKDTTVSDIEAAQKYFDDMMAGIASDWEE